MLRLLVLLAALFLPAALAAAQPEAPANNKYMQYRREKAWVVTSRYFVYPDGRPRAGQPTTGMIFQGGPFENLEIAVPVVFETANARSDAGNTQFPYWELRFTSEIGALASAQRTRVPGTQAWYMLIRTNRAITTNQFQITGEHLMYCYETQFNQSAAWDLPWPDAWPAEAAAWLARDPSYDLPAADGSDPVQALIDRWTGGNDPKQIPPVQLAKFMTGNVLDHVRSNGTNSEQPFGRPRNILRDGRGSQVRLTGRAGEISLNLNGLMGGFRIQNAADIAINRVGSQHDLSIMLVAVLRRVGIPARIVIGADKNESSLHNSVKSWVEFAMVAPDVAGVIWVPVDVRELKGSGRSARNWQQDWKNFGTSDLLRDVVPIAHHFHPPANFHSYNFPALYGIRFDAPLQQAGAHGALFEVNSLPSGGAQQRP